MRKSLLFTILLSLSTQSIAQENLTITTYYPSPSGSYNELRAEHIAIGYMNRSEACWDPPCPGSPPGQDISDISTATPPRNIDLIVEGSVGIGTMTPNATLDVVGGVRVGDDTAACGILKEGTIRYNAGAMEYCDGTNWIAMGGAAPIYRIYDPSATPGPQDFTVPQGVYYINLQLWGAGGGGGGAYAQPACPPACASGCTAISGGGAGGGSYIEAGYNVQPGEIYTIYAGRGGQGGNGEYGGSGVADDGDNGEDSTFAIKGGSVILTTGGGRGGKGGTRALLISDCDGGAPAGAGGVGSTVTGDTKLNLVATIKGEKGTRFNADTGAGGDGGSSPNGGSGGKRCNFVWGVGNVTDGEFPGGGGAGGGSWNQGCTSPEAHPGGDGANGKVVLFW